MSGMYGADVAQLRQLARQFDGAAERLDANRMTVGNAIQISAWVGPVAVRFRHQWDSEHSRKVQSAAVRLREAAHKLRANADDQERTSAVGGALGRSAGSGKSRLPPHDADPSDARSWWQGLSKEEQRRLIESSPDRIGAMDGLPGSVRDEANRIILQRELDAVRSQPCPADPRKAEIYLDKLRALTQLEKILKTQPGAAILYLNTTEHPVKVAVGLGDVDNADHVGIFTQGVSSRAGKDEGGIADKVTEVASLRKETRSQLALAGRRNESVAMVVWMGYDSPPGIADGTQRIYAEIGAPKLASFAEGIRANNAGTHLTGLGHSYGSTVTGMAVQQTDAFDSFVAFGSPGVGTNNVGDLKIDAERFYVLETWNDVLVADSGIHGGDPSRMDGAIELKTGRHGDLDGSGGHSEYLKEKSTSQRNLALIAGGLDGKVIR